MKFYAKFLKLKTFELTWFTCVTAEVLRTFEKLKPNWSIDRAA